jgi:putative oxidoreductase
MTSLRLVGRILFGAIFVVAAPRHFTHEGISHAADLGLPLAPLLVPLSGLMALAGGLSLILGYRARVGAGLVIAFLLPVTLVMHAFWNLHDPVQVHIQQAMFLKNLSMMGAALLLAVRESAPATASAAEMASAAPR